MLIHIYNIYNINKNYAYTHIHVGYTHIHGVGSEKLRLTCTVGLNSGDFSEPFLPIWNSKQGFH